MIKKEKGVELRDENERKLWEAAGSKEEKMKIILQYRKDQEEDKKKAIRREEHARKMGLIP